MQKYLKWIRTSLAVCVLMIACLLIWCSLSHVIFHDAAQSMYSPSSIKAHFSSFKWAYACLAGAAVVLSIFALFMKDSSDQTEKAREYKRAGGRSAQTARTVRICIFVCSAVLIALGIVNGGLYDVFVKAVNICTECIGLG